MKGWTGLAVAALFVLGCSSGETSSKVDVKGGEDLVGLDQNGGSDAILLDTDVQEEDLFVPPENCSKDQECEDGNECTRDLCSNGECVYQNQELSCDDGDVCTSNDQCTDGKCVGTAMVCDDSSPCTVDSCKKGECVFKALDTEECKLSVVIGAPIRGATFVGDQSVTVAGKVNSPAGFVKEATLNGATLVLDAEGNFQSSVTPDVGVNILQVEVQDSLDRRARAVHAFLFANEVQTLSPLGESNPVVGASQLWIGQDTLDDDDPSDLDDIASLVMAVMENLDINTYIPHPLFAEGEGPNFAWCEWDMDVSDVSYLVGPADIVAIQGGLHISASLTDLSAHFSAVADWCPDAIGMVYADLVAIEMDVLVSLSPAGNIVIDLDNVSVNIDGIEADITEGTGQWFDWIINWFDGTISGIIEGQLEDWFPNNLEPMLAGLLQDFTSFDVEFDLPAVPGNNPGSPVGLSVWPSYVAFAPGGGRVDLDIGASAFSATNHVVPGSILRGDCNGTAPGTFALPQEDDVEASVEEDAINQILFAVWAGGHLDMKLGEDVLGSFVEGFGISDLSVEIDPYLPPVVTSCTPDGSLEVQLGDLFLSGDFTMAGASGELELFASAKVRITPQSQPGPDGVNQLGLVVEEVKVLAVQVVDAHGVAVGAEDLIEGLLVAVVVDTLVGDYLADLLSSYPIPSLDLADYIDGMPAGSTITFNPLTVVSTLGNLLVGGKLINP